jgi:lysophospholipase L1-like esterase
LSKFARRLQIITIFAVLLALTLVSMPIIFSQPIRHAYLLMIDRQIAKVVPPRFVFAGDSLTASGNWGWILAGNPLSAANLADFGASINDVAVQVSSARAYHAAYLLVMAGTNDLLTYRHTLEQIVCDYRSLLDKAPTGLRLIVTLIPYTSFPEHTDKIRAVNSEIRRLSEHKGADIIDINAQISTNGILNKDLTTDGVHFNQRAYQIWSDQILKLIK